MTAVARGLFAVRRGATRWWGLLVALALWPLLGLGVLDGGRLLAGGIAEVSVVALFAVTLARAVMHEVAGARPSVNVRGAEALRELELGLLLLTGVYVLLVATGGLRSFLHPLAYALISFLMVIHRRRWVAAGWLASAVALEVLVGLPTLATHGYRLIAYHLTFLCFFAVGNLLILSSLAGRLRRAHGRRLEQELERMRQEARDFRLIASQLPLESRSRAREEEELKMAQGAVQSIREQLFHSLDLLRGALDLNTCVLLWVHADEAAQGPGGRSLPRLAIKELTTKSEMVGEQEMLDGAGLLAGMLRDPRTLRLKALAGRRNPPYYAGPEAVTDLCAVPLLDGATLRGVLCADRTDDRPFSEEEEHILDKAAQHVLRIIAHERVFAAVERGKYEQERFYQASELLNQALTLEDVHQKTFAAVRAIADYDIAVITGYDAHARTHEVLAVDAPADEGAETAWTELADRLAKLSFEDGDGLVAIAVKNRHFLPASGDVIDQDAVIFTERTRLRRARSLLVLPLVRGDEVLGTITLASARPHRYGAAIREMLRVISHQVGVSLQNARMYQSMQERATTDGLTGLTNHRAFQERFAQLHALAERAGTTFSVILTDIDHFKGINDTYGHPAGDRVLKRIAALFTGRARKVDIVARYGGEEFALVLPDTAGEGAAHFANKLREEVAEQMMTSEHGSFKVTISMGIAEYPADGSTRRELVERADQALYYCKEHGRNRVRRWSEVRI